MLKQCIICNKTFSVRGKKAKETAKFCSYACKNKFQSIYLRGENSHRWIGGIREKTCQGCGKIIVWKPPKPYSTFLRQKFCTKPCADKHGFRYKGKNHPNWKGGKGPRDMFKQLKWAREIFIRDNYTCQDCGKRGGDLQAHHIKGFTDYPNLRWKLSNGTTLCRKCHYKTYKFHSNQFVTVTMKNGVNSVKVLKDNAEPAKKITQGFLGVCDGQE